MRAQARELAEQAWRDAVSGLFGFIGDRIDWRRANAPQLALEAERMVYLLETDPGPIAFRKLKIWHWRRVHRKHAARAWAASELLSRACGLQRCA